MKKLLLILFCMPFIGFGQTSWTPCDSSFSISINSQDSTEVVYSVSGPNFNMNSNFSWVYFNMLGQCIGGSNSVASHIDTLNALNINNITDSTAIMCLISDSLSSCIVADTLVYDSLSGWSLLSVQLSTSQTYVPDDNFEAYLEANGMGNGIANDDYVTTANINSVTMLGLNGINSVGISNISDLTGIEGFAALEDFSIIVTQITTLDLSANTALTYINCTGNQLTSLDVSGCVALTMLSCDQNQLTSLDVSQNIALITLACFYNQITSLDLSQNPVLMNLACSHNNLSSLDARNGINFTYAFNASSNPNLTCISVDDIAYATANYFVDPQTSFSLNCVVPGCTDSLAANYDPFATIDDSSCVFPLIDSVYISQPIICFGGLGSLHVDVMQTIPLSNYKLVVGFYASFNPNFFVSYLSTNQISSSITSFNFPGFSSNTYFVRLVDSTVYYNANGGNSSGTSTLGVFDEWPHPINFVDPPLITTNQAISACISNPVDSVLIGNNYYTNSGIYIDSLISVDGCDSVVNTNLTIGQNTYSYDTLCCLVSNVVWNGINITVSGDYSFTLINSLGCDSIANLNVLFSSTGILDVSNSKSTLIKITDILGQETPYRRGMPLLYIYDDGTVEKRIVIE